MLKKIGGLARAIYILLAIVAGFVALGMRLAAWCEKWSPNLAIIARITAFRIG